VAEEGEACRNLDQTMLAEVLRGVEEVLEAYLKTWDQSLIWTGETYYHPLAWMGVLAALRNTQAALDS